MPKPTTMHRLNFEITPELQKQVHLCSVESGVPMRILLPVVVGQALADKRFLARVLEQAQTIQREEEEAKAVLKGLKK